MYKQTLYSFQEQPLLLEDLLEQEKREQQQQMPQQQQQQQQLQAPPGVHPQGPGIEHMMVRPGLQMQQQPQLPPGAAPGPMTFVRNPMVQPPQRLQWQVRHAQEVTLQQRGPMGMGGPSMMVGGLQRLPMGAGMIAAPMPLSEPHSVMGRQEPTPPPGSQAPAPLNVPPMTPPPENPQSEDDKQKVSFCKIYFQLCILLGIMSPSSRLSSSLQLTHTCVNEKADSVIS